MIRIYDWERERERSRLENVSHNDVLDITDILIIIKIFDLKERIPQRTFSVWNTTMPICQSDFNVSKFNELMCKNGWRFRVVLLRLLVIYKNQLLFFVYKYIYIYGR